MNALVVDDDYFVVTALEKKIDWKALNIETVYTANNVAQAREILQQYPVQILVSDIEMPQGSGLELLAWIREENYSIQTIFLTNYADFNYAQKAIELQSFEYFLKPIEFDKLMLIIQKAVVRAKEQQSNEKAIQEGYLWQRNHAKIREHFWRKLISESTTLPANPAVIAQSVAEQNLPYQMADLIQPLLLNIFPHNGSMGLDEKGLFDFALLNVLYELFHSPPLSVETILEYKDYNWMLVLKWKESADHRLVKELCDSFILKANEYLKCDACCNIALPNKLEAVSGNIKELLQMNEDITKNRNRTFVVAEYEQQNQAEYLPPDLAHLEELLNQNKPAAFLEATTRYLKDMTRNKRVGKSVLGLFRLDIIQLVYAFLKMKGIQAHKLYAGKANEQLLTRSLNSVEDLEDYLRYLVNTALEYRDFAAQPKSVVEEIKQYIHTHYGDELTRNDLAEIVYLNPDYLARIFKKETGVSLGSYVIQVRVAAAKHLLQTSGLSVYAVASKVGYGNYSYFSKLFKQAAGCTPNEYKKEYM